MVYRVYVEKKEELANEAKSLYSELTNILGIKGIEDVRILNRYDVENIEKNLFDEATKTVFSEPQLDIVTFDLPKGDNVFATEYLPGQFDQRADSAAQCIQILAQIGQWMDKNSESIYGCGKAGIAKPEYGRITRRGNTLYYHLLDAPIGYLPLDGIRKGQKISARWLASGQPANMDSDWISGNYPDRVFVNLGSDPVLPDSADTVLAVEVEP